MTEYCIDVALILTDVANAVDRMLDRYQTEREVLGDRDEGDTSILAAVLSVGERETYGANGQIDRQTNKWSKV